MGKLIRKRYLQNLTKITNYALLNEIDNSDTDLVFAGRLDCICDRDSGAISGYYKYHFGLLKWEIPYCLYSFENKPEYWHIITVMGLLKGDIFAKFKVLKDKYKVKVSLLNFDGVLGKSDILKLANFIKEREANNRKKLLEIRQDMKPLILALCKDSLFDKIDKIYSKLFV